MGIWLEPGDVIDGKYRVVRQLGEGGMGAVFEAEHIRIERRVAIKVMRAQIARDKDSVLRFEREARAAARIGSSRVADVLDLGELPGGDRFMVMEFLDGESLADRLDDRGRLGTREAVDLVVQLLEGLARVHAAGIIHRDLKPANVFLVKSETGADFVKVLDFGLCKMTESGGAALVNTDIDLLATPAYMSPEHLESGPKRLDARSDLYGVGVILYRALAGRLPVAGANLLELLSNLRAGRTTPVRELVADLPDSLVAVVDKAIEWDPKARFQTASEFREALLACEDKLLGIENLLSDFLEVPRSVRPSARAESAPPRASGAPPSSGAKESLIVGKQVSLPRYELPGEVDPDVSEDDETPRRSPFGDEPDTVPKSRRS